MWQVPPSKCFLIAVPVLLAAQFTPEKNPVYVPSSAEIAAIESEAKKLEGIGEPDVAIYRKSAEWILRHREEFYRKEYATNALKVLQTGVARAASLKNGEMPWRKAKGRMALAYRSRVDGSVQPYGVVIPAQYDPARPIRLDVVLHGRAATMNEVSFLAAHDSEKPVPPEQNFMELAIYGRTNNAYRWAGETDVFEALADVRSRYNIDPSQIVLRGFSMGGAGAWHIGLHYPCQWAGIEAGAGFNETVQYAKLKQVPEYVAPLLNIYDVYRYALNAYNTPTVGYGGEIDPQLQASKNIQQQLAQEGDAARGLRALFLVGPNTAHKWHPDSHAESERFLDKTIAETKRPRDEVRFVTYTLRYNQCDWVRVDGLERHYERAEVRAKRDGDTVSVATRNVTRIHLDGAHSVSLDGQMLKGADFVRVNGRWTVATADRAVRKRHALQGPIDDAFMDAFTTVNAPPEFGRMWDKYFRGALPSVSEDAAKKLAATHNLVLFGEPSTSRLIASIGSRLPIRYTKDTIRVGVKQYETTDYMLRLIAPNPLNPSRYVVLNSGHTFSEEDLRQTNARLYPHLPDWAVIRKADGEVVSAGSFDENWQIRLK